MVVVMAPSTTKPPQTHHYPRIHDTYTWSCRGPMCLARMAAPAQHCDVPARSACSCICCCGCAHPTPAMGLNGPLVMPITDVPRSDGGASAMLRCGCGCGCRPSGCRIALGMHEGTHDSKSTPSPEADLHSKSHSVPRLDGGASTVLRCAPSTT